MRFPWLQVEADFIATGAKDLGVLLDVPRQQAMGMALDLWAWALSRGPATSAPDGTVIGAAAARLIAGAVGWEGDLQVLTDALVGVRLLEEIQEGWRVRGLHRYRRTWDKNSRRRAPVTGNIGAGLSPEPAPQTQTQMETQKKQPLAGSEPRPPVSHTSADEPPDATEHAEEALPAEESPRHEAAPRNPSAAPKSSPPEWPPALQLPPREQLRLSSPKAARTRKPSAAERLYLQLEETRKARCEERGVAFVAEDWAPARQNTSLGRFAKLEPDEQERFEAAWAEYLSDDSGAARNPPWSVGWFLASKSTWESKALRGAS